MPISGSPRGLQPRSRRIFAAIGPNPSADHVEAMRAEIETAGWALRDCRAGPSRKKH